VTDHTRAFERFAGRTVLVTGANGGIGSAVAARLAAEGADVWAADVIAPEHPRGLTLDVTDEDAWRETIAVVEAVGPLDGLYLCQGISQPHVPTAKVARTDWERVMAVNLTGCFLGIKHATPAMVARGYGRVVAIASIAAKEASAGEHVYAASKAGLVGLVKSVGKELASTGVTVNAVAPGPVQTPLWDALSEEVRADRLRRTPMGRPAHPDEVAAIAVWIGSEEARYTTAQVFDASGGRATS